MHLPKTTIVVGDALARFAAVDDRLLTQSQLEHLTQIEPFAGKTVQIGQGVPRDQRRRLAELVLAAGGATSSVGMPATVAGRALTAKHLAFNDVTSLPRKVGDHVYEFEMDVDERGENCVDHLHAHVPAALILELCRQAFCAVLRGWELPPGEFSLLYVTLSAEFHRFMSFTTALGRLSVSERELDRQNWKQYTAEFEIYQFSDKPRATARLVFAAAPTAECSVIEGKIATRDIDEQIARIESYGLPEGAD